MQGRADMTRIIRILRKDYGTLFEILKESLNKMVPARFQEYDHIDWLIIASHSVLLKADIEARSLTEDERFLILNNESAYLSDKRIKELMTLFWVLSKVQSDPDLISVLCLEN